jgi:cytochrome P450
MSDFATIDFFSELDTQLNPDRYFDFLRAQGPVARLPHHNVVAVTGLDEALAVYKDPETFSSCNSVTGPFPGLPADAVRGDDASGAIAKYRGELPMNEYLVTQDPPKHKDLRSLLMRLFTPKRMSENEGFMWRLADKQIDEFIGQGRCDLQRDYSQPFALQVIADLLGVPEEDHMRFRAQLGAKVPGRANDDFPTDPLAFLDETFTAFVEDRRKNPRNDVLTSLAMTTLADGTVPEVSDVVRTATFLFAAGQETTATLMTSAMRILAEKPALQDRLRAHPSEIPAFIEEVLRLEGPVKTDFRLARRTTKLGGVEIPAGATVMIALSGVDRDPRRFECPHDFNPARQNAGEHLAFGRGIHACPGGPLARQEARVSFERLLARLRDISIDETVHGKPGERRFDYVPTYVLRGLMGLHIQFKAVST